ncbi:saccharopine dehydrogenase [Pseudomonas silvicola]|nr:saccharopine dehydrogenase [Pseudomonas silvicola]
MRVIIIGGLGNFGARICRRLALEPGLELIATGRKPISGSECFGPASQITTAALDIDSPDLQARLAQLRPHLVIHCAGPYQGQDYRVALAACAVHAHYLDLSDGRDFVADFSQQVDAAARAAGVLAVTGASTLPGLSSAVVDQMTTGWTRLDTVEVAIAPGQQAPRGEATIKAVFGYAGQGFKRWQAGRWATVHGWQDLRRFSFAELGSRWGAACDVPDLALFPERYPGVQRVSFHAALELRIQHLGLWLVAALRRVGLPLPVARHAGRLNRLANVLLDRFGSDLGGMRVRVKGQQADGRPADRTWHLTAPDGNGPEIPCMATVLLACKLARGQVQQTGAVPCMGLLTLSEFAPEFARWGFVERVSDG